MGMNLLDKVATGLLIVGGLNWGVKALNNSDLLVQLANLTGQAWVPGIGYLAVGASAVYVAGRFILKNYF